MDASAAATRGQSRDRGWSFTSRLIERTAREAGAKSQAAPGVRLSWVGLRCRRSGRRVEQFSPIGSNCHLSAELEVNLQKGRSSNRIGESRNQNATDFRGLVIAKRALMAERPPCLDVLLPNQTQKCARDGFAVATTCETNIRSIKSADRNGCSNEASHLLAN